MEREKKVIHGSGSDPRVRSAGLQDITGRARWGREGSGRVESKAAFKISRVGPGQPCTDPTCPDPRGVTRSVNRPENFPKKELSIRRPHCVPFTRPEYKLPTPGGVCCKFLRRHTALHTSTAKDAHTRRPLLDPVRTRDAVCYVCTSIIQCLQKGTVVSVVSQFL